MDSEYYFIGSSAAPNIPLLKNDDTVDMKGTWFLYDHKETSLPGPVHLCFGEPVPKVPNMADYLTLPQTVFSKKIYDALKTVSLRNFQMVPAVIRGNEGAVYDNYWLVNNYNYINSFDKENCVYKENSDGSWRRIKKIAIDYNLLNNIPLEERLIYKSKEARQFEIYHKSIVDMIMAANPEGLSFIPIDSWYEGIQFKK
ncbi:hypothetical protein Dip510_000588 [Elusimicrobium posterum]|uniref:imm11 family protein n=1 Tax=Elusimicrobium posterum TaxID=3116653 RepID=UPI003C73DE3F